MNSPCSRAVAGSPAAPWGLDGRRLPFNPRPFKRPPLAKRPSTTLKTPLPPNISETPPLAPYSRQTPSPMLPHQPQPVVATPQPPPLAPPPHPSQSVVATLVRNYDLQLLSEPVYIPWTHMPVSVPDKRWPVWARLSPSPL